MPKTSLVVLLDHVNRCWETGEVPEPLKLTLIFPIPKPKKPGTCPTDLTNLRPISLTPVFCKLIERLINNRMTHYLEYVRPYFHPAQTGFRPNLSTHHSLWLLRRVINRSHHNHSPPDLILAVDIRKAFDRVSQSAILEELAHAYPSARAQIWIRNFLNARPIRIQGSHPGWSPRTYYLDRWVPQGSIFSPILFNLAMARVARNLERDSAARFTIYADDVTIWTESADFLCPEDMQSELQAAVNSLECSLATLGLELAPEKTEFLPVFGHKPPPHYNPLTLLLTGTPITASFQPMRLLGIPIGHKNMATTTQT